MPIKPGQHRRRVEPPSSLFTDRVEQSLALRQSMDAIESRLRATELDTESLRNVLVFHGMGGVGKTQLSERLERWLRGELPDADDWGPSPRTPAARTARWNLSGYTGEVDVPAFLIALRAGITTRKRKWPAFDLALAAYLAASRPGQSVATTPANDQTSDVLEVLKGIASDLGAADLITSMTAVGVSKLVALVRKKHQQHRLLGRFESLETVLEACGRIAVGENAPEVAADILWLLTEEVEAADPEDRPLAVVFVDHFERIQAGNQTKGERVLNLLVGSLPWALFVVTGRNRVEWDTDRDGLEYSGPELWPLLRPGTAEDPRQHLLGNLSHRDTRDLLGRRRELGGWAVSDELIDQLVARTDGWPLHIDAVCKVADNRSRQSVRELTADDLDLELPDLVNRLFEDLEEDEAKVFNAACLLPYFDESLAAAVAGTSGGAVIRCIKRTVIEDNPNSEYPYRVHEEIRKLVRRTDPGKLRRAGWSDRDWKLAAERCLAEVERRHSLALAVANEAEREGLSHSDQPVMDALALGLSVALREGVFAPWLNEGVRTAPTIRGLAPRVPDPLPEQYATEQGALVRLVKVLAMPTSEAPPLLEELYAGSTRAAESAGRWRAYRLRSNCHFDEAIAQLRASLLRFGDNENRLYANQISITMRSHRRFAEALAFRQAEGLPMERFQGSVERCHGVFGQPLALSQEYRAQSTSTRFRLELETTELIRLTREGVDCRRRAHELLERGMNLGDPSVQKSCLLTLGLHQLARPEALDETIARIVQLNHQTTSLGSYVAQLLALRAMLSGKSEDARRAHDAASGRAQHRGSAWVGTEIYLEALGLPLPVVPGAQWIIPYDEVRANWLTVAQGVIERAKTYA